MKRDSLAKVAEEQGNRMTTAGLALETLAGLLDEDMHQDRLYGITCAISSIAALVRDGGFALCHCAEQEARK